MKIERIELSNFRCFEEIKVDLHDELSVIVGGNGTGKTAILEGIAVAAGTFLTGLDDAAGKRITKKDARLKAYKLGTSDDIQSQYPVVVNARGTFDEKSIDWTRSLNSENGNTTKTGAKDLLDIAKNYQERLRSGDASLVLPMIAYYGTGRLWDYHREKKSDVFKKSTRTNGYLDCLDGTANIKLMMSWFSKKTVQKAQKAQKNTAGISEVTDTLDVVYAAMSKCYERITGKTGVSLQYNLDTNEIDCYYMTDSAMQMCMPIAQMSDGYKGTLSLIADIAYRMAILNPQLGDRVLWETPGIVLIDEVDLHLHPAWQHRILADLREIFPKIQFIVTTHAPAVISSVKSESLVILNKNETVSAEVETYGEDVNTILTKVMGAASRVPAIAELFSKFSKLLTEKKFDEAEKVLDEIDEQRDYHDNEVVANRVKLSVERIRGGKS